MSALDLAAAVPDPRVFPALADAPAEDRALYRLADQSLQASTRQEAEAADAALARALAPRLAGDGRALAALIEGAPAVTIARHLWRQVERVDPDQRIGEADRLVAGQRTVFALPLVLVAGIEAARGEATLPGTLADAARVVDLLREHGALAGNQSIGLANALVGVDAIDLPRLPGLLAWQRLPEAFGAAPPVRVVAPRPLAVSAAGESVHLRFLVGSALARPGAELFGERGVGEQQQEGIGGDVEPALQGQQGRGRQREAAGAAEGRAQQRVARDATPVVRQHVDDQRPCPAQGNGPGSFPRRRQRGDEPAAHRHAVRPAQQSGEPGTDQRRDGHSRSRGNPPRPRRGPAARVARLQRRRAASGARVLFNSADSH